MNEPLRLDVGLVRSGQITAEAAIGDILARPLLARGALERGMVNAKALTSRAELYRQLVQWFAKDRGSDGFHQ
jgi:hypothetical protein